MWGNYLTVGLRALVKNRTYAFINIFGLAVGLAACLILLLYVRYETSYDAWIANAERVYQVQSIHTDPETGHVTVQQGTHGAVADPLEKDFPQIEAAARADTDELVLLRGSEPVFASAWMTEPEFFKILKLPFLRGDPETALAGANNLVMSRTEALRLFGTIDVVGRSITNIRQGEKHELRVSGVFEDLPRNSHMTIDNVGRISAEDAANCSWGCVNGSVYVKLKPGASVEAIHQGLPAWEKRNIPPSDVGGVKVSEGDNFDWRLVNVRDVHLSGAEGSEERPTNDRTTIITFTVIALLILGIASANFVNLATARASQRAREVALRKVVGANRRQLIVQFLSESLLLTAMALLIAVALAELALPWLSAFLGVELSFRYFGEGGVIGAVLLLWLVVGLAGGLYPAFYLSRYQPGAVLKANRSSAEPTGAGRLRSALVVAQFAVSIGLIVCTIVIYSQTRFVRTTDPGYRRDGLIQVGNLNRAALLPVTETLIRETSGVPGVQKAAAGAIFVASGTTLNNSVQVPGRAKPVTIGWYSVSPEFFDTLGIDLLVGRTLSNRYANDNHSLADVVLAEEPVIDARMREYAARGANIVVNRLAAEQLGFADPAQALGKTVRVDTYPDRIGMLPATIVGVVEDSRFRSMREPPEPMIFHNNGLYRTLIVRYEAADPEAVRNAIGSIWKRLAPDVPFESDYAEAELAELYRADQARGISFAGFAALAVIIACLGLFGLAAYTAERRTKEIGIRKVFGARVRDIVQLLAWQFSKPVIIANLIAWPVAWWVMRDWLNGFDARIALTPGPFVLAGLIALVIAVGTIAGHAVKVARANPILALRYE
jgi:putative ABC transport system permease protein